MREPLIFAALEANQVIYPIIQLIILWLIHLDFKKYRYRERNRKFRDWHALDLTPLWLSSQNIHQSTYKIQLT